MYDLIYMIDALVIIFIISLKLNYLLENFIYNTFIKLFINYLVISYFE